MLHNILEFVILGYDLQGFQQTLQLVPQERNMDVLQVNSHIDLLMAFGLLFKLQTHIHYYPLRVILRLTYLA